MSVPTKCKKKNSKKNNESFKTFVLCLVLIGYFMFIVILFYWLNISIDFTDFDKTHKIIGINSMEELKQAVLTIGFCLAFGIGFINIIMFGTGFKKGEDKI